MKEDGASGARSPRERRRAPEARWGSSRRAECVPGGPYPYDRRRHRGTAAPRSRRPHAVHCHL